MSGMKRVLRVHDGLAILGIIVGTQPWLAVGAAVIPGGWGWRGR